MDFCFKSCVLKGTGGLVELVRTSTSVHMHIWDVSALVTCPLHLEEK